MNVSSPAPTMPARRAGDAGIRDYWRPRKRSRIFQAMSAGLKPADTRDISSWAEASLVLSARVSMRSGPVRLYPYQREPLNAVKSSQRVVLVWGTQTGKTILLQCVLGWCIDQNPMPAMVVCPDKPFAERRSRKHLRPFIEDSPVLAAHLPGNRNDLNLHEYTLDTMSVTVAWAGSASQMAGEPVGLLIRDEFDKYPDATEKEANAFLLAFRRTASFGRNRKVVDATTPTVPEADGWQELIRGTYERLHVPCPHCAEADEPFTDGKRNPGWQILEFDQFRYPQRGKNGEDPEEMCDWQARARKETVYVCRDCGQPIPDTQRWRMVRRGVWVATNPQAEYRSFHLPSWYAQTDVNSFGEVAARYLAGLEDPGAMRDWYNADAAEPYRDAGNNAKEELILAHCSDDYEMGTVPTSRPCILIATADLHKQMHYCTVWALTPERMYLVDALRLETLEGVEAVLGKEYRTLDGRTLEVEAVFPDCQYRTEEVYTMHLREPRIIPTTGKAVRGVVSWAEETRLPKTDRPLDRPVSVLNVSDTHFAEELLRRFASGATEEGFDLPSSNWILPRNTPREFVRSMLSMVVVEGKNSRGFPTREWMKVGGNHYWDTAKYALAAAYVLKPNLDALVANESKPNPVEPTTRVVGAAPPGWAGMG